MKLNSQAALEVGRQLYSSHGGDWSRVRDAGHLRRDGVIEVDVRPAQERSQAADRKPRESAPTRR